MPGKMAGNIVSRCSMTIAVLIALTCTCVVRADDAVATDSGGKMFAIAIHGGAGTLSRKDMSSTQEAEYRAGLEEALNAGYAVLSRGGSSLDAAVAAVRVLEDNPLFNAGRGAVLNRDGVAELDASLIDGRTLSAGAVSGLQHVKNPIDLARLIMEKSPHVMLVGAAPRNSPRPGAWKWCPTNISARPRGSGSWSAACVAP